MKGRKEMEEHLMTMNVYMRCGLNQPPLNLDKTEHKQTPFLACRLPLFLTSENVQSLDNKATSIGDV